MYSTLESSRLWWLEVFILTLPTLVCWYNKCKCLYQSELMDCLWVGQLSPYKLSPGHSFRVVTHLYWNSLYPVWHPLTTSILTGNMLKPHESHECQGYESGNPDVCVSWAFKAGECCGVLVGGDSTMCCMADCAAPCWAALRAATCWGLPLTGELTRLDCDVWVATVILSCWIRSYILSDGPTFIPVKFTICSFVRVMNLRPLMFYKNIPTVTINILHLSLLNSASHIINKILYYNHVLIRKH